MSGKPIAIISDSALNTCVQALRRAVIEVIGCEGRREATMAMGILVDASAAVDELRWRRKQCSEMESLLLLCRPYIEQGVKSARHEHELHPSDAESGADLVAAEFLFDSINHALERGPTHED